MPDPLKSTSWPSVDPGNLNKRISIYQNVLDQYGNVVTTNTVLKTWANIQTIKITETTKTLVSEVTHLVSIRYRQNVGIAPGMFVQYRQHTYRIVGFNNLEERDILVQMRCLALNDAINPDLVAGSINP